jgi:hypothetical protein
MNTKCTKRSQNIPNLHKIFQVAIKYINIFQSKALQNLPKLGCLVWKQTIWQPWLPPVAEYGSCLHHLMDLSWLVVISSLSLVIDLHSSAYSWRTDGWGPGADVFMITVFDDFCWFSTTKFCPINSKNLFEKTSINRQKHFQNYNIGPRSRGPTFYNSSSCTYVCKGRLRRWMLADCA